MMIKISNTNNRGLAIQIAVKQFVNYLRKEGFIPIVKISEKSGLDRGTIYGIMGNSTVPRTQNVSNLLESFGHHLVFVDLAHKKEVIDLWNYLNWDQVWEAFQGEEGNFWIMEN